MAAHADVLGDTPVAAWSRPDPRTLLLALLMCNALALSGGTLTVLLALSIIALASLAAVGKLRWLAIASLWIVGSLAFFVALPRIASGGLVAALAAIGYWVARFAIVISLATAFMTLVRPSELIATFQRLRFPRQLTIPLAVLFRFIPIVSTEFKAVIDAMALRGLSSRTGLIFHPLRTIEYVLVPLLSSCARIADDLAASALVRGLGSDARPTSVTPLGFSGSDGIALCGLGALLALQFSGITVVG